MEAGTPGKGTEVWWVLRDGMQLIWLEHRVPVEMTREVVIQVMFYSVICEQSQDGSKWTKSELESPVTSLCHNLAVNECGDRPDRRL